MTSALTIAARLTCLLAFLLVAVPTVSAASGQVAVESARYQGGSNQDGTLTALFVANVPPARSLLEPEVTPEPAYPVLDLDAKKVEALSIERSIVKTAALGPLEQPVADPTQEPVVTRTLLDKVQLSTTDHQLVFQIHLLSQENPVPYSSRTESGSYYAMDGVYLAAGSFGEQPTTGTNYGPQSAESDVFWNRHYPAANVGHDAEGGALDMSVRGSFVLELFGITLEARHGNDRITLASGTFDETLAAPLPAYRQREVLVRLFVEDGTLRLASQGGRPVISWGGTQVAATQDGPTTLAGARGLIQSEEGAIQLNGQSYLLPAGQALNLAPEAGHLALDIAPQTAANGGTSGGLGKSLPAVLWVTLAVAALFAAVAIGLRQRSGAGADLPAVERALAAGAYREAARMAGHVLRRNPGQEDARLARAIALSKAGRPRTVVRELAQHLRAHEPADGSLHYVLGLALLDARRTDAGHAALAEAVRRTPALAPDVKARLEPRTAPIPDSSAALPNREAHGYA